MKRQGSERVNEEFKKRKRIIKTKEGETRRGIMRMSGKLEIELKEVNTSTTSNLYKGTPLFQRP